MHVKELHIQRFRGFSDLVIRPKGHVIVMGEPGAGRSDLIEALARVLDTEASRNRSTTELDFHDQATTQPIQILLTLADLGPDLEQYFMDHLELWDRVDDSLFVESDSLESIDQERYEWVLRLEYRAKWLPEDERCEEWIYWPKESDPDGDSFLRARRRDIDELGFGLLSWSNGRILDLGGRSVFRRIIERSGGDDFAAAIAQYVQEVALAAGQFSNSIQVNAALEEVVGPLRDLLGIQATDLSQLFQFAPEGGSPSGLLRSLGPSIDLGDGSGSLPAWRRGSTSATLIRISEALTLSLAGGRIVAIDDLGDGLDSAAASHIGALMRRSAGQAWITTRIASVAEVFDPSEVVRLGRSDEGTPFVRQGHQPATKAEAIASKHWHRNLLPALSYRSVVVVEGPNDFAALHALALRLSRENGEPLPATQSTSIINAGMTGSGGCQNVLKLAGTAREIGLRTVGIVDGDVGQVPKQYLEGNHTLSDAVIRLPEGVAIEVAIVTGLPDDVIRQALQDIAASAFLPPPENLDQMSGSSLTDASISFIKRNSLHSAFIDALPTAIFPPLAVSILHKALEVASGNMTGIIQL